MAYIPKPIKLSPHLFCLDFLLLDSALFPEFGWCFGVIQSHMGPFLFCEWTIFMDSPLDEEQMCSMSFCKLFIVAQCNECDISLSKNPLKWVVFTVLSG